MTEKLPESVRAAVDQTDATSREAGGFTVTTTVFDAHVTVEESIYTVTIRVPTINSASADEIGPAVATDWRRTLERRLRDAPQATRSQVDLDEYGVEYENGTARIEYRFSWDDPSQAVQIAKTFVEYVEGTYVEGVIPGYEYEPPVSDLLADATQSGDSGTPL